MHDQVTSEKLERIHAEIERLHGSIRSLDRDAKNSKHVLWLCLLAIPAYLLVGGLAATLVVLFTVALLATALY
ncbi:MAG: hypothetical protein H5U40_05000, partial [Polyangiaceae bacterium]|nr:hypothetical protein [Polyangiaceae bacterium]